MSAVPVCTTVQSRLHVLILKVVSTVPVTLDSLEMVLTAMVSDEASK